MESIKIIYSSDTGMTRKGLKTINFIIMKKLIENIKSKFSKKPLLVIPDVRSNSNFDENLTTWGEIFDDMTTSPFIDIKQVRECDITAIFSWLSSNYQAPLKK